VLETVRCERPGFDYAMRELHRVLPTMTEKTAPVVGAVAQGILDVFGHTADYVVSPGTYDQKHIDRIGRLKNCIAYGPGILDLAHKPDEFVGVEDMVQSAQVMALALLDLLVSPARA
jgi:succinyl-diaminopimelate desuccinylase